MKKYVQLIIFLTLDKKLAKTAENSEMVIRNNLYYHEASKHEPRMNHVNNPCNSKEFSFKQKWLVAADNVLLTKSVVG